MSETTQDNPLTTLVTLCSTMAEMERKKSALTEELELLNERIKDVSTRAIPDLMSSLNLTELRLTDGSKIAVKPDILASVSKERMPAVLAWLHQNNAQSIAKEQLIVSPDLSERLAEADVPYERTASIHPSTLRAFVKEHLEQGTPDFPRELFGVHEGSKAVITTGR